MAYMGNDGGTGAPGRATGNTGLGVGRITGILLIAAAVLTIATFWMPVMTFGLHSGSWDISVWRIGNRHHGGVLNYLPTLRYVLIVVVAGVAGLLLTVGAGARRGVLFWVAAFASGMMLQTASSIVVSYASQFGDHVSPGSGFWVFVLVMLIALAALVTGLRDAVVSKRGAAPAAGGAADRIAGVFLVLAVAVDFGASFVPADSRMHSLTIWDGGGSVPWPAAHFALGSIVVVIVAIALLAGIGVRNAGMRAASGAAAAFVFTGTFGGLIAVLATRGLAFWEYLGAEFILIVLTLLLSVAATIAGLVAQLARPRLMAQPRAGYSQGFAPVHAVNPFAPVNQPAVAGPNPFAAAAVAPNPFAAPNPAPNPLVSGPNPMVQNPFAPAQTGPGVEATVRIEPEPARVLPPRMAKVYDGKDDQGRPVVNRPELEGNSRVAVLAYLESAPIVLAARSFDQDEFAPADRDVPLTFRTDGVWIWAGAVSHYLNKHGLMPEPELVQHIVSRGFRVGTVDEAAKDAAIKVITGG
ncbi:hypothetical protein [Nocardia sp. NPDC004722]